MNLKALFGPVTPSAVLIVLIVLISVKSLLYLSAVVPILSFKPDVWTVAVSYPYFLLRNVIVVDQAVLQIPVPRVWNEHPRHWLSPRK